MISSKTDIPVKSIERYVKRLKDAVLIKYSGSVRSYTATQLHSYIR
ncbi:MAG: hypothetical protein K6F89_08030 [Prevotella sp.]|nr:hypothetical protein [Prevotella sp.]